MKRWQCLMRWLEVELYYDANKKIETTSMVTITGALTAGGLTYPTTNGTSGQVLTSDGEVM